MRQNVFTNINNVVKRGRTPTLNDTHERNEVLKLPNNINHVYTVINDEQNSEKNNKVKTNNNDVKLDNKRVITDNNINDKIESQNINLRDNLKKEEQIKNIKHTKIKEDNIERLPNIPRPGTDSRHRYQKYQTKLQTINETSNHKPRSKTVKTEFTCPICLDTITHNKNTFTIKPCDHKVCINCMKENINVAMKDMINLVPTKCPYGESCKGTIDPELNNLGDIMNKKDYSRLVSTHIMKTYIDSKFIKNCPNPKCGAVYDGSSLIDFDKTLDEVNFMLRILCPECEKPFCSKCNVEWHEGMSCKEYKEYLKNKNNINENIDKNNQYIQNYCKKCPTCKAPVEKTQSTEQEQYEKDTKLAGGTQDCNHMTCANCKVDFCWTCLKTYRGTEYYHHECPTVDVNIHFHNTTPYIKNLPYTGIEYVVLEINDGDKLWKRNIYSILTHRRNIHKIKKEIKTDKIVTVYCNKDGVVQKISGKKGDFCFRQENYANFDIDSDDPVQETKFILNNRFYNQNIRQNNQPRNFYNQNLRQQNNAFNNINNQFNFFE